jgi:hypothetical protein
MASAALIEDCWPVEQIPNSCILYYRIHRNQLGAGNRRLVPGLFHQRGDGDARSMSTDWGKYSTAAESQQRANPGNGIVRINVADVRALPNLTVEHSPDCESDDKAKWNRAHTDVKVRAATEKEWRERWTASRIELVKYTTWVIEPPDRA